MLLPSKIVSVWRICTARSPGVSEKSPSNRAPLMPICSLQSLRTCHWQAEVPREAPPRGDWPRGTLVLLHAFPLNASMWEPQLALAAHGWRVLAPHLGGSTAASAGSAGLNLLDTLHVTDAIIGGLSMGGYVAFAIAGRHARRNGGQEADVAAPGGECGSMAIGGRE